jgi:EpsI family protein
MRKRPLLRLFLAVALLAGTTFFLQLRSRAELLPAHEDLASFPKQLGDWTGRDLPIEPDISEVLGAGVFLLRDYARAPNEPSVNLFVAYFPSQRMGSSIHSPKNCLPGGGWMPLESSRMLLSRPDGKTVTVNRYVIARGLDRQLVLYWYQAHGRVVPSEYWAKFYLVADAIRMNRTDGSLIRVLSVLDRGETVEEAQLRELAFTGQVLPLLDRYIPR